MEWVVGNKVFAPPKSGNTPPNRSSWFLMVWVLVFGACVFQFFKQNSDPVILWVVKNIYTRDSGTGKGNVYDRICLNMHAESGRSTRLERRPAHDSALARHL